MKTHQFTLQSLKNEVARIESSLRTAEDDEEYNWLKEEKEAFEDAIETGTGYACRRGIYIALGTFNALFDENGNFLYTL